MIRNNDMISPYQLAMIVIMTVIGVGVFNLVHIVAKYGGNDGWLIIGVLGLVHVLLGLLLVRLGNKFPGETFPEYIQKVIGVIPGKTLVFLIAIYIMMNLAYEVREFTEVAKMFLLPRTPTEVIIFTLIIVCVYVVRGGVESVARIVELTFPWLFIPFFLVLIPGLTALDLSNLLPFTNDIGNRFTRMLPNMPFAFRGMEYILFYMGFMKKPEKAYKSVTWAVLFITFFYTLVSVICLSAFGEKSATKAIWPLLVYIRNINLPGLFIERLDGIILTIWVVTVFTTIITGFYIVTYSLSKLLNTKEHKQYAMPLLMVIYYLALQPSGLAQLYEWGSWGFKYISTVFIYAIPVFTLIIASLRKLGVKKNEEF